MERIILLKNKDKRNALSRTFGVTKENVSQSLLFQRNGNNNVRIRMAAMQSGGVLLQEVKDWNITLLK